jgi:hypothetical protein
LLSKASVITTEEVFKLKIAREEADAKRAIKDAAEITAEITAETVAKTAKPGLKNITRAGKGSDF